MLVSSRLTSCIVKVRLSPSFIRSRSGPSLTFFEVTGPLAAPPGPGKRLERKPGVPPHVWVSPRLLHMNSSWTWSLERCASCGVQFSNLSTLAQLLRSSKKILNMSGESIRSASFVSSAVSNGGYLCRNPGMLDCVSHFSMESGNGLSGKELKRELEELTDLFMETRELLTDAMETKGSVYFDNDLEDARQSLEATLGRYRTLLGRLSEEQKRNVVRTIGLKMDELRAQEAMIMDHMKGDD